MTDWLRNQWFRITPWHVFLLPLSGLFWWLATLRRALYRLGLLHSIRLPVPVIIVGNITAGGAGKTPLVLWLAAFLRQHGYHPGIISRGYGGSTAQPQPVLADSNPLQTGDEPVLLARRSGCPVWAGRDRVAAAGALLRAYPQCDVLLSDDGLQHYRLARDVEIIVVDGKYRFGNGLPLPAGPLRETPRRLQDADAVVVNGAEGIFPGAEFSMQLKGEIFYNLRDPDLIAHADAFRGKTVQALAGIGNPQRFFAQLRSQGIEVQEHAFPDHYVFRPEDLHFATADAILMTEKDAVKCAAFAPENCWFLAVTAALEPAFEARILEKLRDAHGC